jgi:hypothetical protein
VIARQITSVVTQVKRDRELRQQAESSKPLMDVPKDQLVVSTVLCGTGVPAPTAAHVTSVSQVVSVSTAVGVGSAAGHAVTHSTSILPSPCSVTPSTITLTCQPAGGALPPVSASNDSSSVNNCHTAVPGNQTNAPSVQFPPQVTKVVVTGHQTAVVASSTPQTVSVSGTTVTSSVVTAADTGVSSAPNNIVTTASTSVVLAQEPISANSSSATGLI